MASEQEKLKTEAATWYTEDQLLRLHRCRVHLHNAGVMVDHEASEIGARINKLEIRVTENGEFMEDLHAQT